MPKAKIYLDGDAFAAMKLPHESRDEFARRMNLSPGKTSELSTSGPHSVQQSTLRKISIATGESVAEVFERLCKTPGESSNGNVHAIDLTPLTDEELAAVKTKVRQEELRRKKRK